jgi:hypothetical protein
MRKWPGGSQVGPRVGHRIVLPCAWLRTAHLSRVVAANDVNLPAGRDIAASGGASHVRHVCTRGPCIGRDVINPRDVEGSPANCIRAAEYINLVRRGVIDRRSHHRRLGHVCQRRPSVQHWIIPVD